MRIVFMGTPDFAASILEKIASWPKGQIVGVYSQPDRAAKRGQTLTSSPVKIMAQSLDIPVYQPLNFKQTQDIETLSSLKPDILIVAAYGLILPQAVLDIPKLGPYNVHGSLLPLYRGAAPIQRSIIDGQNSTGITIMRMEAGLDTGPMILQRALAIGVDDNAATLYQELADLGARLMLETLNILEDHKQLTTIPQDDSRATYASRLEKSDGIIDWNKSANEIHNLIRGVCVWPKAQSTFHMAGRLPLSVILEPGKIGNALPPETVPGSILGLEDGYMKIACKDKEYLLKIIKPSGKKSMNALDFYNGYNLKNSFACFSGA